MANRKLATGTSALHRPLCRYPAACLMVLFFALAFNASAAESEAALYTGEAVVADQSAAERDAAIPVALANALAKLTGIPHATAAVRFSGLETEARNWMQGFAYTRHRYALDGGQQYDQLRLIVRFDPGALDRAVREMRLPLWPKQRRATRLFMALDDGAGRRFLDDTDEFIAFVAADSAQRLGLPLSVHLAADGETRPPVRTQEIWGGFTNTALRSARALGQDNALLAAAYPGGDGWQVRWSMNTGSEQWNWRSSGATLSQAIESGIQASVSRLAGARSIAASDQGSWVEAIDVINVSGPEDYARCLDYLAGLGYVDQVDIAGAQGARVRFRLSLNAVPGYLFDELDRSGFLYPVGQALGGAARVYELQQ